MKILFVIVSVFMLSGASCAHLTRDVYVEQERPRTSQAAKQPCADPVVVPDRDLTEDETLELWGQDRSELGSCGGKNRVLTKSITVLEGQHR